MARKIKGLSAIKAAGGIIDDDPKKIEVEFISKDGEELSIDVWVKPMAFGMHLDRQKYDNPQDLAAIIGAMVMIEDEDGNLHDIDAKTVRALSSSLGPEIFKAISAANEPPKNSQPPTSSSANSSLTELAAEPSQKQERPSASKKSVSGRHTEKSAGPSTSG